MNNRKPDVLPVEGELHSLTERRYPKAVAELDALAAQLRERLPAATTSGVPPTVPETGGPSGCATAQTSPPRKPDVLPVEGASIAEALEALKHLHPYGGTKEAAKCCDEAYRTIRSALERAAAEGEARGWEPWPAFPRSPRCESTNPNHYDFRCCLDLGHEGQHQASAGNRMDAIKWASKGEE